MNSFHIKELSIKDLDLLQSLARRTFYETFSGFNTEEDMKAYLEVEFSSDKLSGELMNPNSFFYAACNGDQIIAYLKVNFENAQSDRQLENAMEIERIYVLRDFHGKEVGELLLKKAKEVAEKANVKKIWLGVWENNLRAIRFYEKHGFRAYGSHIFKLGKDEQNDILMKLEG